MNTYNVLLLLVGLAILGVAWLPSLLEKYALSYPILYLGLGMLAFWLPLGLPDPDHRQYGTTITHLTELCVIVALTGTGLKIDRKFSWRAWRMPLRLVLGLMVLTIGAVAGLGWWLAALAPASAVLLAAALAPTDPVLAGDVQVGDPGEGGEDHVRFALTTEAGLNDGLAFPFVWLAVALVGVSGPAALPGVVGHWALLDVGYRTAVGLGLGWLAGQGLAFLIFNLSERIAIKPKSFGFVALAVTLLTYGTTELLRGYGFLAVFVAAVTLRSREREHEFHKQMHAFSDQLERIFIVVILIGVGAAIANGILDGLTWGGAAVGLLLVLVLRPALGLLVLVGTAASWPERGVIAGFGIRGIGSLFYLSFALEKARFPQARELWAITAFVILLSVCLHGVLATPVMAWLDHKQGRAAAQDLPEPAAAPAS